MPAKSEKQQRFMAAVANNPKFAKKVGVPKSVGEEFMKKKGYMGGGMMRRYAGGGKLSSLLTPESMKKVERSRDVKRRRAELLGEGMDSPGMGVSEEDIQMLRIGEAPAGFRPMVPDDEMEGKKKVPMPPRRKKKVPMPPKRPKKMKSGGKVRGCGLARGGRPCKMVRMKGA